VDDLSLHGSNAVKGHDAQKFLVSVYCVTRVSCKQHLLHNGFTTVQRLDLGSKKKMTRPASTRPINFISDDAFQLSVITQTHRRCLHALVCPHQRHSSFCSGLAMWAYVICNQSRSCCAHHVDVEPKHNSIMRRQHSGFSHRTPCKLLQPTQHILDALCHGNH